MNRADWHARPATFDCPGCATCRPESRRSLLLAAIVLVVFCAAFYSLIVGLGA
jgi:hypothetical protein